MLDNIEQAALRWTVELPGRTVKYLLVPSRVRQMPLPIAPASLSILIFVEVESLADYMQEAFCEKAVYMPRVMIVEGFSVHCALLRC